MSTQDEGALVSFSTYTVEQLVFAVRRHLGVPRMSEKVGEFTQQQLKLEVAADHELRHLIMSLETRVLGKRLEPLQFVERTPVPFSYPETWFQHVKQDLPGRLGAYVRERWPVRVKTTWRTAEVNIDARRAALFPESDYLPSFGELGRVVFHVDLHKSWEIGDPT